jgi:uncharacterized protein
MALFSFPRLLAYGDGGFRFADGRRDGSVTVINGTVAGWPVRSLVDAEPSDFDAVLAADPRPDFLLLGAGARIAAAPEAVRERLRGAGVGLEVMDTPTACRVYASLLIEGRRFAAALIAVQ